MRPVVTLSATLLGICLASSASAFCRKTTCEVTPLPADCIGSFDVSGCSNEGKLLHWTSPCLSYSVNRAGSAKLGISADQLEQQVRAAFDAWGSVSCVGGGSPNLYVAAYPQSACPDVGFRSTGPNRNLWVFRDDIWEHAVIADGTLALTTLSVVASTGEIYDVDVELNSKDHQFTTGTESVVTDLFSIVLHEAGHVLGIGHSPWSTSTMSDSYRDGTLASRTLEADDINAVCAIMPPGELPATCDPEPRQGFSTRCDAADAGCCSIHRGYRQSVRWLVAGLAMLLLAARYRRSCRQR